MPSQSPEPLPGALQLEECHVTNAYSEWRRSGFANAPVITGLFVWIFFVFAGCADPGPEMMPAAPVRVEQADGGEERLYDTNRDEKADYHERLGPDGRVVLLRFDLNGDGQIDDEVERAVRQFDANAPPDRHLLVILDSVPFALVQEAYARGRFRLFYPPRRTIAPFPVMTDVAMAEFFGTSPSLANESQFYADSKMRGGYRAYADELVAGGWLAHVDYHMRFWVHSVAYFWPFTWFDHEMGNIQRQFYRSDVDPFVGYVVCTSGIGARYGRDGHQGALVRLDRFCQSVMHRLRGRVQITLMSDHGHHLGRSYRIPLPEILERMGYHVTKRLKGPQDVAVPQFGVVSCAALHTQSPSSVAHDLAGVDGVELAAFVADEGEVVVVSRGGRARISSSPSGLKYECDYGDPLEMLPVIANLRSKGGVDAQGFAADRALFEATTEHKYPDSLHRLWRGFHGLVEYQPDVLLSTEDGRHCGSAFMSRVVDLTGSHGNLGPASSSGFVMTTAGELPPVLRIADLRAELAQIGVPLDAKPNVSNEKVAKR